MANNGNIITKPVCIPTDINAVLGISVSDVGRACTHAVINKWAKYKPVPYPSLYDNNYAKGTCAHCDGSPLSGQAYGIRLKAVQQGSVGERISNLDFEKVSINGYFRLLDFDGYRHDALPSIIILDSSTYANDYSIQLVLYEDSSSQNIVPFRELVRYFFLSGADTLDQMYVYVCLHNIDTKKSYVKAMCSPTSTDPYRIVDFATAMNGVGNYWAEDISQGLAINGSYPRTLLNGIYKVTFFLSKSPTSIGGKNFLQWQEYNNYTVSNFGDFDFLVPLPMPSSMDNTYSIVTQTQPRVFPTVECSISSVEWSGIYIVIRLIGESQGVNGYYATVASPPTSNPSSATYTAQPARIDPLNTSYILVPWNDMGWSFCPSGATLAVDVTVVATWMRDVIEGEPQIGSKTIGNFKFYPVQV